MWSSTSRAVDARRPGRPPRRPQRERRREDAEPVEDAARRRREQVVAPRDHVVEAALAGSTAGATAEVQLAGQAGRQLLGCQHPQLARGQLDGERQAVEPTADAFGLGRRAVLADRGAGRPGRGRRTVRRRRDRAAAGRGGRTRPSTPSGRRLVASTRTSAQAWSTVATTRGTRLDHVLAVVEHEQRRRPVVERGHQRGRVVGRVRTSTARVPATAAATRSDDPTPARSTSHTPPGSARRRGDPAPAPAGSCRRRPAP